MDRKRNMHLDKTAKQVELFNQKLNDNFSDNNALIVGDSKVRHLSEVSNVKNHVRMIWRKGANINNAFLTRETGRYISRYRRRGPVTILLWHGTCELTTVIDREKLHINFSTRPDLVNRILADYMAYKERIKRQFPETRVLFIEIPFYSIISWNKKMKHPHPDIFEANQQRLELAIIELNNMIKTINEPDKVPCISQDMILSYKKKKKHTRTNKVNFELLLDGIHPGTQICTLWLKIETFLG